MNTIYRNKINSVAGYRRKLIGALLIMMCSSIGFAAPTDTARFTVATNSTLSRGATADQTIIVTNAGPSTATGVVVTYRPPTTAGITVKGVTASPGGPCTLATGAWTCPSVATVALNGTVTLIVNMTVDSSAPIGTSDGSTTTVNSNEFNPGSGTGESLFNTWGASTDVPAIGAAFWFAFDGTYTNTGNKVEGASNDIPTAWPVSQANPPGAYNLKADTTTVDFYTNPRNGIFPYGTTAPTATVGPKVQSVVTSPPTVVLAESVTNGSAGYKARDNRRVWEVRTGIYLNAKSPLFVCVGQPDDGLYVTVDGTVVAKTNIYNRDVVVNTSSPDYQAGYHEIVYRIVNRNDQAQSWEGGAGGFGFLGIGSTSGTCTSSAYNTFTMVAPSTNIYVEAPALSMTKAVDTAYVRVTPSPSNDSQLTLTPASLKYTLTVKNDGLGTVSTVKITDTLPAGLTIGTLPTGCVRNPTGSRTVECSVATLASSASKSFDIPVTPTITVNTDQSAYSNTASVIAAGGSAVSSKTVKTDLVYTKLFKQVHNLGSGATATSPAAPAIPATPPATYPTAWSNTGTGFPGDVLEYCINFYNYSSVALNNYGVSDNLPVNTKYIGGSLVVKVGTMLATTGDWSPVTKSQPNDGATSGTISASGMTLQPGARGTMCFRARIN